MNPKEGLASLRRRVVDASSRVSLELGDFMHRVNNEVSWGLAIANAAKFVTVPLSIYTVGRLTDMPQIQEWAGVTAGFEAAIFGVWGALSVRDFIKDRSLNFLEPPTYFPNDGLNAYREAFKGVTDDWIV